MVFKNMNWPVLLGDILFELEKSGDGCRICTNYYGCVGYADDLKLLCPDLKDLQRMLKICNQFSCSNGLTFNATKTMCIQFHYGNYNGEIPQYPVYLVLDKLQWY